MGSRTRSFVISLLTGAIAATGLAFPTSASASTVYTADQCGSTGNSRCVMLMYNSVSLVDGLSHSSCFISDINIPDFSGYYAGDGIQVYYVFRYQNLWYQPNYLFDCASASGDGQGVKNNAAAAVNETTGTAYVYYNSGYAGAYQSFAPGHGTNLNATLKNQNASQKIVY